MKFSLAKVLLAPLLALALLAVCNTATAQGTATGPFTSHFVDPGPIVLIGDPASPIPIDLDPTGPPWFKSITDPGGVIAVPSLLTMIETIENVGTEPWYDWHEHILPNAAGIASPSTWFSVKLSINGTPIGFVPTGLGTQDLWLDTFSQPVLPGDIFVVEKEVEAFPLPPGSTGPILRISEFPTPEPASLALLGLGSLSVLGRRKEGT
jgi:PEP-CTERM motif